MPAHDVAYGIAGKTLGLLVAALGDGVIVWPVGDFCPRQLVLRGLDRTVVAAAEGDADLAGFHFVIRLTGAQSDDHALANE